MYWRAGGRTGLRDGQRAVSLSDDRYPLTVPGREPDRKLEVNATDTPIVSPVQWEEPIRAELFGIERLEQHARTLAAAQRIAEVPSKGKNLLPRVRANGQVLLAGYRDVAATIREKSEITPAAEWLLDNFHIVEEQIRGIRDHLPGSYYRLLPKIVEGHLAGFPRVYGLAWAYVAHTDSRFELETLQRFVRAYQSVQPLTIGELWAVTIHLRVVLVENLRRLSQLIVRSRKSRASADELADRLLGLSSLPVEDADDVFGPLGDAKLRRPFAVQLVQRLRDQGPSIIPAMDWLNEKLAAQGTSAEEVVSLEHYSQAAANVTVRNIITSMRWMSSIDWLEFFEEVSLVDEVLRDAPGFAASDFATRDAYRAQIEVLSRGSGRSEMEVAQESVRLARDAARGETRSAHAEAGTDPRGSEPGLPGIPERAEEDPGYYLLSRGRPDLERLLEFRVPLRIRLRRFHRSHSSAGYLGTIAAFTALLLYGLLFQTWTTGAGIPILVLLGILGLLPASAIAVSLVHRLVPILVPPKLLPKLELFRGIPPELRTLVVVPMLLTSRDDIEEQVEHLEVHYLSNPEGHLHFALVSDWADAPQESMPGDEDLLTALADGIAGLNQKYEGPPGEGSRFFLLHRRRLWNEKEGKWIGWERKRGKLHELNKLLRGAKDTSFLPIHGQSPGVPQGVRYVLTLDADTRLPKGSAYRLVGAAAHPLNRPRFDARKGRVVGGYAVLQPGITPSLPTGPKSTAYQRIVSGPGGVDPYASAFSDVYQDLFEEGSYTGKGIYDVDAFEAALEGRVPENALLSHDLFEGLFTRAGLVTDVGLFEEFPTNYLVAAGRHHRWVRGDWQLLPWIMGTARDGAGRRQRDPIPPRGRWKMVDNLRRSLVAPFSVLAAVIAWTFPGVPALLWTGLLLGSVAVPTVIPVLDGLLPRRGGISKRSHLRAVGHDISVALSQTFLALTMLAHQAWLMLDAIVRTLWRLYISKRDLLEWVPAAQAIRGADLGLRAFYWKLRWSVVLAVGAGSLFVVFKPGAWLAAGPLICLWMLAPFLARRMSVPAKIESTQALSPEETRSLRLIARRTWRFFETFVDEEEHSLPPDNFQEDPEPVEAHRTSPTNLGLYLLSAVAAHDFGWIGILDMAERLEATLGTMSTLHRVRGHFCNWYDTRDLRPLEPIYLSTVDSGNLAGHLLALAQACRELMPGTGFGPDTLEGVRDALQLVLGAAEKARYPQRTHTVAAVELQEAAAAMSAALEDSPTSLADWADRLEGTEGPGGESSRHRPHPLEGHQGRISIRDPGLGRCGPGLRPEPHPGSRGDPSRCGDHPRAPSLRPRVARRRAGPSHGLRLSLRSLPPAVFHRLQGGGRHPRSQQLRPPGLRGQVGELRGRRQGRRLTQALVPPRPVSHTGGAWCGSDLLVGIDVRVPDAPHRDATTRRESSGSHLPPGSGTADPVRCGAEGPVGGLGIGLQRSRRASYLSVFGFWRSGLGAQARPLRGRGGGSLRHRPRSHGGSQGGPAQLRPTRGRRCPRRVRLLRSPRFHPLEVAGTSQGGRGPGLHGSSPGNDHRFPEQRGTRRPHPEAFSLPSLGASGGTSAPGTDAASSGRGPPPKRGGSGGRTGARHRSRHSAAIRLAARPHTPYPSPLQRPLFGHGHGGGLGVQPVGGPRRHPLAGGYDPGLLGLVPLPEGRGDGRGLVCRVPAQRNRSGRLRRGLFGGPGKNPAAASLPLHRTGDPGFPRGRRRTSPPDGHQSRGP